MAYKVSRAARVSALRQVGRLRRIEECVLAVERLTRWGKAWLARPRTGVLNGYN